MFPHYSNPYAILAYDFQFSNFLFAKTTSFLKSWGFEVRHTQLSGTAPGLFSMVTLCKFELSDCESSPVTKLCPLLPSENNYVTYLTHMIGVIFGALIV